MRITVILTVEIPIVYKYQKTLVISAFLTVYRSSAEYLKSGYSYTTPTFYRRRYKYPQGFLEIITNLLFGVEHRDIALIAYLKIKR